MPDYRSVDLLRRAQEEGNFAPEQYQSLRDAVVEDERSLPSVRKQFQEVTRGKEEQMTTSLRQSRLSLNTARRLLAALEPMGSCMPKTNRFSTF